MWKRGTAAHIFNFSTKYRVGRHSHISLRKRTHSTTQTVSRMQALCSWDAAVLIKILLMLGLELYAPRSKLVTLVTQPSQLICIVCSIIILLPISSFWLFKYGMQYDTIMKILQLNIPLIFSMPSVTWKSTIEPSKKKRSHIRKSIFMWTTDANNVRNQCRVMRLSSISCSLSVMSTSGRKLQIMALSTRWSACIPAKEIIIHETHMSYCPIP